MMTLNPLRATLIDCRIHSSLDAPPVGAYFLSIGEPNPARSVYQFGRILQFQEGLGAESSSVKALMTR